MKTLFAVQIVLAGACFEEVVLGRNCLRTFLLKHLERLGKTYAIKKNKCIQRVPLFQKVHFSLRSVYVAVQSARRAEDK